MPAVSLSDHVRSAVGAEREAVAARLEALRAQAERLTVLGLALTACSETTVKESPNSGGGGGDATGGGGGAEKAGLGDTITLAGSDDTLQVDVTGTKVEDPAKPDNKFFGPKKTNRYVAVQIELTVVGESPYSDSPTNGAYLIDADGQQFDADITSPVGPSFGGSSKIASGDSRTGFITFEIPKNAKPATFQFTLDSGFGPETGEWEL